MNLNSDLYCRDCLKKSKWQDRCSWCGKSNLVYGSDIEDVLRQNEERQKWIESNQERIDNLKIFTVDNLSQHIVEDELGLVSGSSSKLALWGLSKQSKRLDSSYEIALFNLKYEAAMIGANAIIGLRFALNNSTGSALNIAGSSEAIMLIGTAVIIRKINS